MFAPCRGLDALRRRSLDSLELKAGDSVLELGCGPGDVTAELLRRGATVHAIDSSPEMLSAAAKRAPAATFERSDVRTFSPRVAYDVVLIFFVLHELAIGDVNAVIERATSALASGGRLAIVDHAIPAGSAGARWRTVLHLVESRRVDDWLNVDLLALLRGAGLRNEMTADLAGGRAQLIVGTRQ